MPPPRQRDSPDDSTGNDLGGHGGHQYCCRTEESSGVFSGSGSRDSVRAAMRDHPPCESRMTRDLAWPEAKARMATGRKPSGQRPAAEVQRSPLG